jgi:flavodoxin
MKKILIAYATMAGSTREVAEFIGKEIKNAGFEVDVKPVEDMKNLSSPAQNNPFFAQVQESHPRTAFCSFPGLPGND